MHSIPLYAPKQYATPPTVGWSQSDFSNVDDTVRGGNSSSSMQLVKSDSKNKDQEGEIIFSGYLGKSKKERGNIFVVKVAFDHP